MMDTRTAIVMVKVAAEPHPCTYWYSGSQQSCEMGTLLGIGEDWYCVDHITGAILDAGGQ